MPDCHYFTADWLDTGGFWRVDRNILLNCYSYCYSYSYSYFYSYTYFYSYSYSYRA